MSEEPNEEAKPDMLIRLSIPKTVSMEDAMKFAEGLMKQIEDWHKLCEPEEPSIDLTQRAS